MLRQLIQLGHSAQSLGAALAVKANFVVLKKHNVLATDYVNKMLFCTIAS